MSDWCTTMGVGTSRFTAEGITFDEAVKAIELEVEQLKAEVTGGKTIAIDRVGRLYKGSNDRVQFLADEEMERMLRSFGLRNIPLRPIARRRQNLNRFNPKGKVVPCRHRRFRSARAHRRSVGCAGPRRLGHVCSGQLGGARRSDERHKRSRRGSSV